MRKKLSERELGVLERYFIDAKGRGFSVSGRLPKSIKNAISFGFVQITLCSFFNDRRQKRYFVFTEQTKQKLVERIARRYELDPADAHHLVLTGCIELANKQAASNKPKEPAAFEAQQEAFQLGSLI